MGRHLRKDNCGNYVRTQSCKLSKLLEMEIQFKKNSNKTQEVEELCQESNASCKSIYVPGETNVIIYGKSVLIGAGIKSLDPPCLGRASPFGQHPYTCDACWNQRVDLKDVLNKRKKSRLIPGRSRLGVCGFRKSYASKSETEVKSEELNAENVSLKKENGSLRQLYLYKKSCGKC